MITKLAAAILIQRDDLEIVIDGAALPSTLGLIITALIDTGRALGEARRQGMEMGMQRGYEQCRIELETSTRIAERQASDLVDALAISGLVAAA